MPSLKSSVLCALLLAAAPHAYAQALERITLDVEKQLEKEVEERLSTRPGQRLREMMSEMFRGATAEEAITKQVHSVATGLAIKALFLPAVDSTVPVAARNALRPEFDRSAASLLTRYSTARFASYCSANEHDCACLTASELSRRVGSDLAADLQKHPAVWMTTLGEGGPDAVMARLTVRTSVYLAEEMVTQAGKLLRPGSYCDALQAGAARVTREQVQAAVDEALGLTPGAHK